MDFPTACKDKSWIFVLLPYVGHILVLKQGRHGWAGTYLIFVTSFTLAKFLNPNILHPKFLKNTQKLLQIASKSIKYAVFCVQSGKFYTGQNLFSQACGACDKYEVWAGTTFCLWEREWLMSLAHFQLWGTGMRCWGSWEWSRTGLLILNEYVTLSMFCSIVPFLVHATRFSEKMQQKSSR